MNKEEIKKDIVIKTVSYLYNNNMLKNIYTGTWSGLHNSICESITIEEPEEKECFTCIHLKSSHYKEPCKSCQMTFNNWESK